MKVFTVGRSHDNQIRAVHPSVSGRHLQLVLHDDGNVSIVNIDRQAVTLVNGIKIQGEHFLKAGDVVYLGDYPFDWEKYVRIYAEKQSGKAGDKKGGSRVSLRNFRHHKEIFYFSIISFLAAIIWVMILFGVLYIFYNGLSMAGGIFMEGIISLLVLLLIYAGIIALIYYLIESYFRAILFGYSVSVTEQQYPELHRILLSYSKRLGISAPEMFVYNGNGIMNAMAVKFLKRKYIILMGDLVDLLLSDRKMDELGFVIGHELGHHYAGHTSIAKSWFLKPGKIFPFIGAAYSRACELTADRVGFILTGNKVSSQKALVALASGSKVLIKSNHIESFIEQERKIPLLAGFIHKIFSSHPRLTKRVLELQKFNG